MGLDNQEKKISSLLLFRVFWRSFFVQAVWNFERLLGFGLTYMMLPVIFYLYPVSPVREKFSNGVNRNEERRRVVIQEYLTFFNTHPYLASAIAGVLISEEEKNLISESSREKLQNLKIQIMGPLGALGDTFFWASLRPLSSLLGVSLVFLFWDKNKFLALGGGLFCFFCFYNFFHILIRLLGVFQGYKLGIQIVNIIKRINLQKMVRFLSASGVIIIGAGLVIFSFSCSLFNLGEFLNLNYFFNVLVILLLFTMVSLLLSLVTSARMVLLLILLGELLAWL